MSVELTGKMSQLTVKIDQLTGKVDQIADSVVVVLVRVTNEDAVATASFSTFLAA